MQAAHVMVRVRWTASGDEEWLCPECGRRMLLRWPPDFEKVVLEPGDERSSHIGGSLGLSMDAGSEAAAPAGVAERDRQWLRDNGIDWDGAAA